MLRLHQPSAGYREWFAPCVVGFIPRLKSWAFSLISCNDDESSDVSSGGDDTPIIYWNRRELLKLSGVGLASVGTAPLVASSDATASEDGATTISIDNVGASAWEVTSIDGDAAEAPLGEENPSITLDIGSRYGVENGGWSAHPLEIRDEADEPLLSQDADVDGRFEADVAVEWVDNDDEVALTLTEELAAACDSYICTVHGSMRGQLVATDTDDGSPSEIEDWNDLDDIREDLAGDYVLVNDLNEQTAGYDEHVSGPESGFNPIGGFGDRFTGTFDGQNREISDLEIDRPDADTVGLFGDNGGTIRDITLTDLNIAGDESERVGGLVGVNQGTVVGVAVRIADIVGSEFQTGGIAGSNSQGAMRELIVDDINITGEFSVGGLAGLNDGEVSESVVRNSIITGDGSNVGGLIGNNVGNQLVESAAVDVDITGAGSVGGLVGVHSDGEVIESFAGSEVSLDGGINAGGFIGTLNDGTITAGYWNTETANQPTAIGDGSGDSDSDVTGLTTDEMQGEVAAENMTELDFDVTWDVVTDPDDYPILQFEDEADADPPPEEWTEAGLSEEQFAAVDQNGDGELSRGEVRNAIQEFITEDAVDGVEFTRAEIRSVINVFIRT